MIIQVILYFVICKKCKQNEKEQLDIFNNHTENVNTIFIVRIKDGSQPWNLHVTKFCQSSVLKSHLLHFPAKAQKIKKKTTPKKFLNLFIPSSNIKKILAFSQKKACLIFSQMKPCNFHSKLQKQKKSTLGKFLILQETETPKRFLCFPKRILFLYFRKRKSRSRNPKEASSISGNLPEIQKVAILFCVKKQSFIN